MALINALHPPKAPPVRIAIKTIICRAAAAFDPHAQTQRGDETLKAEAFIFTRTCTEVAAAVNIVTF